MNEAEAGPQLKALDLLGQELSRAASRPARSPAIAPRLLVIAALVALLAGLATFTGPGKAVAQDVGEFLGIANPDDRADIRDINEILATPGNGDPTKVTDELLDRCAQLLELGEYNVPCIEFLARDAPERLPADIPRP